MALFRWEFERRREEGVSTTHPMATYLSAIMGMRISEEAFQCGHLPTRSILGLYDYVEPNDSDVAACLFLCNQIEILQKTGMLQDFDSDLRTNPSEMAKLLKAKTPAKNKNKAEIEEKTINWDDDD